MAKAKPKARKQRKRSMHVVVWTRVTKNDGVPIDIEVWLSQPPNGVWAEEAVSGIKEQHLCGKPLSYTIAGNKSFTRREPHVWMLNDVRFERLIDPKRSAYEKWEKTYGKRCKKCFELATTNSEQRKQLLLAVEVTKAQVFAAKKLKAQDAKIVEAEMFELEMVKHREDAAVVRDMIERHEPLPQRCTASTIEIGGVKGAGGIRKVCRLPKGHAPFSAENLHCYTGPLHLDINDVLTAALRLQRKLDPKSRGDRLVVQVEGYRTCNNCGNRGDSVVNSSGREICAECSSASLARAQKIDRKHVACRFCRKILGRDQKPFVDYSKAFFDAETGELLERPQHVGPYKAIVDVYMHTVRCALEYLAPTVKTEQDDAPILANQLPAGSFVLEHDQ